MNTQENKRKGKRKENNVTNSEGKQTLREKSKKINDEPSKSPNVIAGPSTLKKELDEPSLRFISACLNGDINEVVQFLSNNPNSDLNIFDESGKTPLWLACCMGHLEIVQLLLNDKRIDVNQIIIGNPEGKVYFRLNYPDAQSLSLMYHPKEPKELFDIKICIDQILRCRTPFDICPDEAILYRRELVRLYFNDIRQEFCQTPFSIACKNGNTEIVKLLLSDERIDVNQPNIYGSTPFFIACKSEHIEIVKLLLNDQRVDVNKGDQDMITPFYAAFKRGYFELVKLLLNDKRIDRNATNCLGETPFYVACEHGQMDFIKLFLNDKKVKVNEGEVTFLRTPFYLACRNEHMEVVKLLLNNKRININKPTLFHQSPFYIACSEGRLEVVKYMLASGRKIDLTMEDDMGNSCIETAIESMTWDVKEINETEEEFQERKKNCAKILELIVLFERNRKELRSKLRVEVGLTGKFLQFFMLSFIHLLIFIIFFRN